jgi:hypothetical protein
MPFTIRVNCLSAFCTAIKTTVKEIAISNSIYQETITRQTADTQINSKEWKSNNDSPKTHDTLARATQVGNTGSWILNAQKCVNQRLFIGKGQRWDPPWEYWMELFLGRLANNRQANTATLLDTSMHNHQSFV